MDEQNVHNHSIQESIRTSVKNILKIKPVILDITKYIINDTIITDKTKQILLDYQSNTDIYSVLDITFAELLMYVINRIEINENKDKIKSILNIEMNDSSTLPGRLFRLINCLSGFDPLVTIQIADNEEVTNMSSTVECIGTTEQPMSLTIEQDQSSLVIPTVECDLNTELSELVQSLTTDLSSYSFNSLRL
jgi:hypothetical protein